MERLKELAEMARQRPGVQIVCISSSITLSQQKMQAFLDLGFEGGEWVDRNNLHVRFINGSRLRFLDYDHPSMIRGWEADVILVDTHGMKPELRGPILTACKERLRGKNYPLLFSIDDAPFEVMGGRVDTIPDV